MNPRALLFWISTPIQKLMQKLHPPEAQTMVAEAEEVMKFLEDGDILLSREKWHFTNLFIPGFFSHAALYGKGQIIEAVGTGVQIVDWRDWVIEKHFWIVLRVDGDGSKAFAWAVDQVGSGYDYQFGYVLSGWLTRVFKQGVKKLFYCSGLVFQAWKVSLVNDLFKKSEITPDDIYQLALRGKIKTIYEHRDKDI